MKKAILAAMLVTGILCSCTPKEQEPAKTVDVILNVSEYAGISETELIDKMGEPESREEWNYEKGLMEYPIVSCFYGNNRFEFLLNNDHITRITIQADSYNDSSSDPFYFDEKEDILAMIGLTPEDVKYAKKTDTNSALRYEKFGNITSVWIPEYKDNSFDEVKIDFSDLFN